jgi:hypothetical protein
MAIPEFVASLSDVPEALREHYTPVDPKDESAGFNADIDGTEAKRRVNEFRSKNIELMKERETLGKTLAQFEGVDPESIKKGQEALAKLESDEDRKLWGEGKFDELLQRRMGPVVQSWEAKLEAREQAYAKLEEETSTLRQAHERAKLDGLLQEAVAKAKVRVNGQAAMGDLMMRARGRWKEDPENPGRMLAHDDSGTVIYGERGAPIDMAEYISRETKEAPHLFEQVGGAGAPGAKRTYRTGGAIIDASDHLGFGRNIDNILEGKVKVVGADADG